MAGKTKRALEAKKTASAATVAKLEKKKPTLEFEFLSSIITGVLLFIILYLSSASTVKGSAIFCIVLMLVIGAMRYKTLRDRIWIPLISLSLYVLIDGISTFYAVSGKFALSEFLKVLIAFCGAVTLLALSPKNEKVKGQWMATVLAVCVTMGSLISLDIVSDGVINRAVISLFEHVTSDYTGLDSLKDNRLQGIFNNANIQGGFSALGVLLSLGLANASRLYSDQRGHWKHGAYLLLL